MLFWSSVFYASMNVAHIFEAVLFFRSFLCSAPQQQKLYFIASIIDPLSLYLLTLSFLPASSGERKG